VDYITKKGAVNFKAKPSKLNEQSKKGTFFEESKVLNEKECRRGGRADSGFSQDAALPA